MNSVTVRASGSTSVSTEKTAMLVRRARRRPKRSVSGPTATAPMPTPTRPRVEAQVSEASVNPRAPVADSTGMTTPSTTRSKPSRATATQQRATGHHAAGLADPAGPEGAPAAPGEVVPEAVPGRAGVGEGEEDMASP